MTACPICSGSVIGVAYGYPVGDDLLEAARRHEVVIGGCIVDPRQRNFVCSVCGVELEDVGGQWEIAAKPSFLLTWNPTLLPISPELYDAMVTVTASADTIGGSWSTGSRTQGLEIGHRAYLVRQDTDRGIVGSGRFTSEIYPGPHRSGQAGMARYTDVTWEVIVPVADRLPIEDLLRMVADVPWNNLPGSGVQVAPTASAQLFRIWETHLESIGRR